jgi:hypothetical protein
MAEPPGARGHSAGPQQRSRLSRLVAGQQRSDPLPAGSETASRVLHGKPSAGAVPCRLYWLRNLKTVHGLGAERGGVFAGGMHFRNQAGQARSVLSLISYLWSGQYRERYLGVKIPSASIQDYLEAARKIATGRPAAGRSPARALPQTRGSSGGLASGWAE